MINLKADRRLLEEEEEEEGGEASVDWYIRPSEGRGWTCRSSVLSLVSAATPSEAEEGGGEKGLLAAPSVCASSDWPVFGKHSN